MYCRRAWHYRRQGLEPANQSELAAGTELHRQHGRKVMWAGLLRGAAILFMLAALAALTAYLTSLALP